MAQQNFPARMEVLLTGRPLLYNENALNISFQLGSSPAGGDWKKRAQSARVITKKCINFLTLNTATGTWSRTSTSGRWKFIIPNIIRRTLTN